MLTDDDILVISNGFWDEPKRVRHKMPLAWAHAGNRVLWIEQPPFPPHDWRTGDRLRNALRGNLAEAAKGVWVGSAPPALPGLHRGGATGSLLRAAHRPWLLHRIRGYMRQLDFRPKLLVLFQQPTRFDLLDRLPHDLSIYYCYDLYGHGRADAATLALEQRCCERVDAVFATSAVLRERLRPWNPEAHHMPHAVDAAWWEANCERVPPEMQDIPSPRAVYTGVVQEKIDFPLLTALAKQRPNIHFVLAGPIICDQIDAAQLRAAQALPNVHFLGARDVDELPGLIAAADLLMLPYVSSANQEAAGLSLKFYEYFVSGKPVLATPYTNFELDEPELLYVEPDAESWARRIDALLADPSAERDRAERREALARRNSYAARIETQRATLEGLMRRRAGG